MSLFPELIVWFFLSLASISIIFKQKLWIIFFLLSVVSAFFTEVLTLQGTLIVAIGIVAAYVARKQTGWVRWLFHTFLIVWGLLLATHTLSGFNNIQVIDQAMTGVNSIPFSMSLNIDKPMLIFAFVILLPTMLEKPPHVHIRTLLLISIVGLTLLPLLGYFIGIIKPELSLPSWIGLFAFNNLFLTCVVEEVFFRGYLQNRLSQYGVMIGLTGSSLLFGLAHFSGGVELMMLATLAGVFYGAIYLATGKLYMAIVAHFLFNMYHLIFYTYPLSS